jgi:hypothetical protein
MIMGANNGGCFNQADLDTLVCAIWVSTRPGSHAAFIHSQQRVKDGRARNIKLLTDYHSRRRDNFIYSHVTYTPAPINVCRCGSTAGCVKESALMLARLS